MPKFKDPKTGQVVNVSYFLVFLSSLLFGMFFFLYIGETQHALVMVGFAILITLVGIFIDPFAILYALIFPIIYSFIAPKIVKDKWLNKGYIKLEKKEKNIQLISEKKNEVSRHKYISIKNNYIHKIKKKKIKPSEALKESIKSQAIIINLYSNFLTLFFFASVLFR